MLRRTLFRCAVVSSSSSAEDVLSAAPSSDQARVVFARLIKERKASNQTMRKYINDLPSERWELALGAACGARDTGYRLNESTYGALLTILLDAAQPRQALQLYQLMSSERILPEVETYNDLLNLCLDTRSFDGAERLFKDMQRRGRRPNLETLETMISVYAAAPGGPNWRDAVVLFDTAQKMQARRQVQRLSIGLYKSIMRVYLDMTPFDWRVVYNAYYEMRYASPKIPLDWEAYEIVRKAFAKGHVGPIRRFLTFLDAWVQITPFMSYRFFVGAAVFVATVVLMRYVVSVVVVKVSDNKQASGQLQPIMDSMLKGTEQSKKMMGA
eukprot:PhM_4_TR3480/c0_g1_i1/m.14744